MTGPATVARALLARLSILADAIRLWHGPGGSTWAEARAVARSLAEETTTP